MELWRQLRIEKIDGSCVRLEPIGGLISIGGAGAGTGIAAVIVETLEATPDTQFWGTLAACNRFQVIARRIG